MGIGGRSVSELNETMTVDEFLRWNAYFQLEPSGGWQWLESMVAALMALIANVNRKKGSKSYQAKRFMLKRSKMRSRTPEEARRALQAQFIAMGGDPTQWH